MSNSNVLPKERQTAYQRWELASFNEAHSAAPADSAPVIDLAAQIAGAREEARTTGYSAGFEAGRAAGLATGRAEAAQELMRLQQIAANFSAEASRAHESVAEDLLELALDIAKAMLKTTLEIRPEIVLPIVCAAIRYLPAVQQPATLFLHPNDVALIKERMGEEMAKGGWRVAEDAQIERGGCRIETASNQVDATAATRWQRIATALGEESDWLS